MKFDIWSNITTRIEETTNEYKETSTRKNFRNLSVEEMKEKAKEILESVPDDAEYFSLNIEKSYEEKLNTALGY